MSNSERKRNIELDVLRVLSCAAVLLYHLGFLKGGYLAVCTFFVMSGYLSARAALSQEKFNILNIEIIDYPPIPTEIHPVTQKQDTFFGAAENSLVI